MIPLSWIILLAFRQEPVESVGRAGVGAQNDRPQARQERQARRAG